MPFYKLGDVSPKLPENGNYWVAPCASLIGNVQLDEEASIWFGAVLRGDNELIHIGARSNIQDGSVLHTDLGYPLVIEANCTIGHKAILHGCCVGEGSLIGMGATVLNGVKIGKGCIIGANALIPEGKIIPDGSLVVGTPGKVIRSLDEKTRAMLIRSADGYVMNSQRFKSQLVEI
ncbi:2,3,4,5-tetrahydropyridine-2,6-dicarboxylate N-acetyltransferase [Pseudovibrio axinellae]|uniref:2,3,4,5-tetrahydropyridine-2,6-dicarboxylate N-acetyltransferase n=1 Tax=Pseudovibrio axinellae TaxID=989403 RepID=A0A166AKZ1_9HYPH|nr:gamma carbonic anhydrase family protein [Pseudovibrio axinellae]KZL21252.1 2,3,4,5-tetrahydropyridine-2,6-dicarboxylate N-acetyltransferase [Pseudovibrio axinellae]SEQ93594.1 Carbonic anhydrase or acetyltransferase, isoleucine patch superfamily [Pseudovibrio axinellae]